VFPNTFKINATLKSYKQFAPRFLRPKHHHQTPVNIKKQGLGLHNSKPNFGESLFQKEMKECRIFCVVSHILKKNRDDWLAEEKKMVGNFTKE